MALHSLRRRMPLFAFLLLAVVCLALLGFACACLTDHPMQALERALAGIPALPALIEVWSPLALATAAAWLTTRRPAERRRPATLQRMLL